MSLISRSLGRNLRSFFTAGFGLFVVCSLTAQDAELTNYKSGIDVIFSGNRGTAYAEEYFYHDKLITDRKVVYIRSDTTITMAHNARNVVSLSGDSSTYGHVAGVNGLDGIPNNGDEGKIRYRVDRDLQWGPCWGGTTGTDTFQNFNTGTTAVPRTFNPVYTAPFTFASLQYESGVPVVGTTGPKPGTVVTDYANHYWRGITDSFGDEWHTIAVADDDTAIATNGVEWSASDGKYLLFVVNPQTPCLTIRATGNAQFYTTPPKHYFIPKVHSQTTYFSARSGSVTFDLRDINGNNVFYRINAGPWSAGTSNPVLTATDFSTGTNTLEYYYAGNAAHTKTRIVVKDPSFPSAGEVHGKLLWGNSEGYDAVLSRLGREPYRTNYNLFLGDSFVNPLIQFDQDFRKGKRITYGKYALPNALAAKVRGWTVNANGSTKSSALYAKQMLLESERNIDPIGFEINHSGQAIPTRELYYRGYYDVDATFSLAFAYDLLIADFKSSQYIDGITPIEDYFIRDQLAGCAFEAMMQEGHYTGKEYANTGMWGTARNIGGMVVAVAMPSYSTPYYGTSGLDGNTTVYPYTPFPDTPLTWKKVFVDNNAPRVGYPNLHFRLGIEEYLVNGDGQFLDRVDYFDYHLMGHTFAVAANLAKIHALPVSFPNLQAAWIRAVSGTLLGLKDTSEGTRRLPTITILNSRFASAASIGIPWLKTLGSTDPQREGFSLYKAGALGLVWYDDMADAIPKTPPTMVSVKISVE